MKKGSPFVSFFRHSKEKEKNFVNLLTLHHVSQDLQRSGWGTVETELVPFFDTPPRFDSNLSRGLPRAIYLARIPRHFVPVFILHANSQFLGATTKSNSQSGPQCFQTDDSFSIKEHYIPGQSNQSMAEISTRRHVQGIEMAKRTKWLVSP